MQHFGTITVRTHTCQTGNIISLRVVWLLSVRHRTLYVQPDHLTPNGASRPQCNSGIRLVSACRSQYLSPYSPLPSLSHMYPRSISQDRSPIILLRNLLHSPLLFLLSLIFSFCCSPVRKSCSLLLIASIINGSQNIMVEHLRVLGKRQNYPQRVINTAIDEPTTKGNSSAIPRIHALLARRKTTHVSKYLRMICLKYHLKLADIRINSIRAKDYIHIQLYLRYIFVILSFFCDFDCVPKLFNIRVYICLIISNHDVSTCID